MKKLLPIILSIMMILPCNIAVAADSYTPPVDEITREEAYQFSDELKEMSSEEYDVSDRLIVSSNKKIDYMDAVDVATGIEGLYVLQFPDDETVSEAYDYYDSLSYVNYVEYDSEVENPFCSVNNEFDYTAECPSTINQNIDDAIKLLKKENAKFDEIKVAVLDSGIVRTKITNDRIDGGHTFIEGFNEDGTTSTGTGTTNAEHGTEVAGTIILNTLDNVRLYSYQVVESWGSANYIYELASVYLAIADGCKIINMSSAYYGSLDRDKNSWNDAINAATASGCICVASAGNDGKDINIAQPYPAMVENTIAVGATTQTNKLASFSNYGDCVDIYATGYGMTSYDTSGNKVISWSGTSASAPVVSSLCALLVTAKPDITVDEIKQLLLETGYSTNDENITEEHRIVADAYGCVKKLLGAELEQVQLDYTVTKNESTGYSDISFSSNDENVKIFYELGLGSLPEIPYKEMTGASQYEYKLGDTVKLSKWQLITVAAHAPGKEKTVLYFSAPEYSNESGYRLTPSSSAQQYNMVDRCQIMDQKVIEVPESINGVEIQEIGEWCFIGNKTVEKIILPKAVKQIDRYAFANCPNLKEVIAPGVEDCGMYAFFDCKNLINVEMPNVTVANTGMFKNCTNLETAKLGTLTEIDNHAFYGCENLKLVKTTADDISFAVNTFKDCNNLTVYTPANSFMETFANQNNIPLLGEVEEIGGSIRVPDYGLRLKFSYNEKANPNIEEYGFIYSYSETDELNIEKADQNTVKSFKAENYIDHGDNTTFNLVFTSIPESAIDQIVSARAYIKIGGEYFYSGILKRSYTSVAIAVLNDDEIDQNTKNMVKEMLET